jgi:sulfur relay (sulfurtransferase) DsrF/TusC family protein
MKVLNIVETAYRATLEEQDDTIIWINHAMKGAGADLAVLLQHNAVYYAVKGQDASGLQFGARAQSQPPRLAEDVVKLIGKGVTVYIVEDDVAERGLEQGELIDGVSAVSRAALPRLLSDYDQIWHW